jgi:hypothetical protein
MTNLRLVAAGLVLAVQASSAQTLRGIVQERESARPVAGAVVMLFDSTGFPLTRTVTTEQGAYSLQRPAQAVKGRVVRLGFRPRDITREELAAAAVGAELVLNIVPIPVLLEPVVSRAGASCPKRKDREQAFGFWEQAKAGLMSGVVAREGNPGRFSVYTFRRYTNLRDSVILQHVQSDGWVGTSSFSAAFDAKDFAEVGFVRPSEDGRFTFFGPDADVLLENDFQIRYCFSLAARDPNRPTQVGLRFQPVKVRPGRVDIDGIFWIDTAARQLRDINYLYLGLPYGAEYHKPGGSVRFRELANGVPFVDAWDLRMVTQVIVIPTGRVTRVRTPGMWGSMPGARSPSTFEAMDAGGLLAHARWPDGTKYDAALGSVRIRAMRDDGTPVANLRIDLDSTVYGGVTDSAGYLTLRDLVPGPYSAILIDTTLDAIGLKLRSALSFVAAPDTTAEAALFVREPAAALVRSCGEKTYSGYAVFVARVATPDNVPVTGARWTLGDKFGTTTSNGVVMPCSKLRVGDKMELNVWRDKGFPTPDKPHVLSFEVKQLVTAVKIELPALVDAKKP